jgi:hypothetical protein
VLVKLITEQAANKTQLEDSSLLDCPEDRGTKLLPNIGTNIPIYTASFSRILESSS